MTRIAIAGFQHETNTFAPFPTELERFEAAGAWPGMTRGADITARMQGLNLPLSGFMGACKHEVAPILWCYAEPGGYVEADAFDAITAEIVQGIREAAPDAVYLDLHGAMTTRAYPDAEAEILARVRAAVGPDMPIAVSLDLHGNLSRAFFDAATVVTVYRTYPHTDLAETGARAARLLDRALAGPVAKAFRQGDYIVPITAQTTERAPAAELYAAVAASPALSADLALGFPPADVPDCGPSLFVYADTQAEADAEADRLAALLARAEDAFEPNLLSAAETVAKALTLPGPVVIADPQDNPGAGGTGDTTGILRALLDAQVPDAILGLLYDPAAAEAAHAAGVGATITLPLGGGFDEFSAPLDASVKVEALSEGSFTCTGPMYSGAQAQLGPMARLRLTGTGVQVCVTSTRVQNADQEQFRTLGLDPKDHHIICVKSAVHFMADYKRIANHILFATAPGANPCDLSQIPFTQLRPSLRLR
ncbi:MAG: M81 family metallopeptidase [Pseudomonadota bacterium]